MTAVHKVCGITMDTSVKAAMNVHRKDGTIMQFNEYRSGLYYYNAGNNHSSTTQDYLFLNTVAKNKSTYNRHEIEGADKARALYKKIGRPSEQDYTDILQNNLIQNCPVTPDDARRALKIYSPDIATLKETKWRHPELPERTNPSPHNRGVQKHPPFCQHILGSRKTIFSHYLGMGKIPHSRSNQQQNYQDTEHGNTGGHQHVRNARFHRIQNQRRSSIFLHH
jgi:hypothetical protein